MRRPRTDLVRPRCRAGFFPRYNRLLAEAGFADDVAKISDAFERGDRAEAARRVPDALSAAISAAGTPDDCRAKIEAYRGSGIALPIVSPRASARARTICGCSK
jgi:alkanesulfonate monooxygenase SsuD/methylene tetrahydromethanopterin reductase-like flavin-dependent oxidoreductase (luciferase family)